MGRLAEGEGQDGDTDSQSGRERWVWRCRIGLAGGRPHDRFGGILARSLDACSGHGFASVASCKCRRKWKGRCAFGSWTMVVRTTRTSRSRTSRGKCWEQWEWQRTGRVVRGRRVGRGIGDYIYIYIVSKVGRERREHDFEFKEAGPRCEQ